MKIAKGFTIIELLVVIAIIGVLSSIVLVNVTKYIKDGKKAAIKGNMATLLTNGAIYYDNNGSYQNFTSDAAGCSATGPIYLAIQNASGALYCNLNDAYNAWCACSKLVDSGDYFCVDSAGAKKQTATACTGMFAECKSGASEGYCH